MRGLSLEQSPPLVVPNQEYDVVEREEQVYCRPAVAANRRLGCETTTTALTQRAQKWVKLMCHSTAQRREVPLSHTEMLHARRRKQKAKKDLAGAAKRAKKLRKQNAKRVSADAPKKGPV
jgi:hypothetical protein